MVDLLVGIHIFRLSMPTGRAMVIYHGSNSYFGMKNFTSYKVYAARKKESEEYKLIGHLCIKHLFNNNLKKILPNRIVGVLLEYTTVGLICVEVKHIFYNLYFLFLYKVSWR
jgi:hypothetical protein